MATTEEYKDGGSASYTFSIEKIKDEDIKVSVDGTDLTYTATNPPAQTTEYTVNGSNVIFKQASVSGSATGGVRIYRETALENADSATFVAGSSIRAADLNANHKLVRFSAQEQNQKIVTDDIRDSQVTSAKILDGTIVDADINASANIQGSKILNDSLTLDKLGAGALPTDITVASANIVDETIVDGDINANANIQGTKLLNDSVPLTKFGAGALPTDITVASANIVDGTIDTADIKNSAVTQNKLDDNSVGTPELINGSVTDAKIETGTLDNRYYTETELDPTANTGQNVLDARYYTETEADARFYNLASAEEIQSGETWVAADNKVATTSAIDARIIDLVDDVGGFHPIPNETSFPSVNVDVNNGAGTLISIKEIVTARTPSSGTVTITDGAGTGNDVVINGCGSTVLPVGFGVIVETTTTLHTYTFHRLQPKATEVTTVAGSIANVNTTAGSIGNVNIVGPDIANVNTVAGSIGSVNTVAGSISSVNNASTNISSINNFGDLYQVNSSNPSTDGGGASLAAGDLYFNTSADRLKVYTGSDWVDGVIASGGGAQTSGDTFTGDLKLNDNVKLLVGTGSDLEIYHNTTNSHIDHKGTGDLFIRTYGNGQDLYLRAADDVYIQPQTNEHGIVVHGNGSVELYYDASKKFETTANGVTVTGDLTFSDSTANDIHLRGGKIYGDDSAINTLEIRSTSGNANHARIAIGEVTNNDNGGVVFYGAGSSSADVKLRIRGTADTVEIPDNHKFVCGDGSDLQIYHDGSHSYITNATSDLRIRSGYLKLQGSNGEDMLIGNQNTSVELYYDNNKKLETTNTGAKVTGDILTEHSGGIIQTLQATTGAQSYLKFINSDTGSGLFTDGLLVGLDNDETAAFWLYEDKNMRFATNGTERLTINSGGNIDIPADNARLRIGASQDLQIYHDGTDSIIDNNTGTLRLYSDNIYLKDKDGGDMFIKCMHDGAVELYHNNVKKFMTRSNGAEILGAGYVRADNGTDAILAMYADNGDDHDDLWRLKTTNSGSNFTIENYASGAWETSIKAVGDGAVELYHNNNKKFETTTTGTTITGRTRQNVNSSTVFPTSFSAYAYTPYDHEMVLMNQTQGNEGSFAGIYFNAGSDGSGGKVGTARISAVETGDYQADLVFSTRNTSFTEKLRILANGDIHLPNDSQNLKFGESNDLQIYHNGNNSFIDHNGGGDLLIRANGSGEDIYIRAYDDIYIQPQINEDGIKVIGNGAVELYHDNVKKLETTSTGATVTGQLEADTFGDIKLADPFIEMAQTITTSRTISNNYNAFTVGPVTINTGVTVTVGDGENWVIV